MTVDPPRALADLTPTIQAYLMAVHALGAGGDPVTSSALAERLGASPSSVSEGVRKLVTMGLAEHRPYAPVVLTEAGRSFAVAMVRRHRIIETFLSRCLEYPWDEVHAEADALEHVVSDRFVDALDVFLDHPRRDPHGDPIPTRDGHLDPLGDTPLDHVDEGSTGVVTRVSDRDNAVLRHLAEIGLRPDSPVEVVSRQVELGIISVSLAGRVVQVGTPVAAAVRVRVDD
ncbi:MULTISPECIES: metal-dependent transcriptional regulator [Dietzia]|uniref:Manganese transport regulator n=1 Tax=Dietzia cinnamea TaxID=321318 RepID=A0AAW5Q526_9ACTN|nr:MULTISPECIES: metal-dependent transcriptional regulator [Dietzia]KZO57743.1 DtxR family transcriptional regulator [Dietzia maris]AVM64713.1 metal-dependent transcriptional regulator [Dietzia sp. oral taxon 368]MCT1863065.1 metal-dependent transcriptional regulator [Dietzia cinnamea]MCT1883687.1 metal-dependent transcriptional regulator [Dietzia cinnamea]MCT2029312.1 metal-dependent transcriptional regulator [Dietzia cinnamea]